MGVDGTADPTVPFRTAKLFAEAMKQAGNRCELAAYEGEVHGFFNDGRGGNVAHGASRGLCEGDESMSPQGVSSIAAARLRHVV